MKTTIDWLKTNVEAEALALLDGALTFNEFMDNLGQYFAKGKEMEKQQIIDAWYDGQNDHEREVEMYAFGEGYYNDMIKSEENGK